MENVELENKNFIESAKETGLSALERIVENSDYNKYYLGYIKRIIGNNFSYDPEHFAEYDFSNEDSSEVESVSPLDISYQALLAKRGEKAELIIKAWDLTEHYMFFEDDPELANIGGSAKEMLRRLDFQRHQIEIAYAEVPVVNTWANVALINKLFEDGYYTLTLKTLAKYIASRESTGLIKDKELYSWATNLMSRSIRKLALNETYFDQTDNYEHGL